MLTYSWARSELQLLTTSLDMGTMTLKEAKRWTLRRLNLDIKANSKNAFLKKLHIEIERLKEGI